MKYCEDIDSCGSFVTGIESAREKYRDKERPGSCRTDKDCNTLSASEVPPEWLGLLPRPIETCVNGKCKRLGIGGYNCSTDADCRTRSGTAEALRRANGGN